jgi:hypothetical protein
VLQGVGDSFSHDLRERQDLVGFDGATGFEVFNDLRASQVAGLEGGASGTQVFGQIGRRSAALRGQGAMELGHSEDLRVDAGQDQMQCLTAQLRGQQLKLSILQMHVTPEHREVVGDPMIGLNQ